MALQNPPRVLVVEDDPTIRSVVGLALEDEGYAVRLAEHGASALEQVTNWHPQCVVLDLMMPVMDGWTVQAELVKKDSTRRIPIILMSAVRSALATISPQVVAMLPKPFDLNRLLETVASALQASCPT